MGSTGKFLFFVFYCALFFVTVLGHPIVNTIYGPIEGFDHISADGHRAEVFLGIPYAKPPIGDLRFEKPQPPDPWTNPFQATRFSRECATYPDFMATSDEEDCLTINIIKPQAPPPDTKGYPVMVFIHGGAFIFGSSEQYNYKRVADGLVSRGVIMVTVNYRLGIFGFFSTGTDDAPGNAGIWDQIESLRFVQKIIRDFKGDPNRVTVFGESAGAVATSYLTITPHANGLFQQAIQMSGSAGAIWGGGNRTVHTSLKIAKELGCGEAESIKECVKQHPIQDIRKVIATFVQHIITVDDLNLASFNPLFNTDLFPNAVDFEDAIQKAQNRPQFLGVTSQEDGFFVIEFLPKYDVGKYHPMSPATASTFTEEQLKEFITGILKTDPLVPQNEYISSVVDFYRHQAPQYTKHQWLQAYVQLFSDYEFNVPVIREARSKAAAGHPVYFYHFQFPPKFSPYLEGAPHFSELNMLFDENLITYDDSQRTAYLHAKANMLDLFTSFAKTGVPSTASGLSPQKVSLLKTPFITIDEVSSVEPDLWPERLAFYDKLAKEYGFDLPSGKVRYIKSKKNNDYRKSNDSDL